MFKKVTYLFMALVAASVIGLSGGVSANGGPAEGSYIYDNTLPEGSSELGELQKTPDGFVRTKEETALNPQPTDEVGTDCIVCGVPKPTGTVTADRIYGGYITNKFDQYLTSAWAGASSYTWTAGKSTTTDLSFSKSLTYDTKVSITAGFSYSKSVTKSYSVSISIPATSSKESKLALYGDYNTDYLYYKKEQYGKVVESGYTYAYEPTRDHYLRVVYR
ncbi:hypothetical protein A6P54_12885 [Bacillus sp. MKU004]|nr:hypothetical protein A6P54_12885 [Bacillus sp. MKU004]